MGQYILLQSYVGSSDFTYDAQCTGRELSLEEAKLAGLVDDKTLRLNCKSSYASTWYEVNPGDEFVLIIWDEYTPHSPFTETTRLVFAVENEGLVDPPTNLNDHQNTGRYLHEYLEAQCRRTA